MKSRIRDRAAVKVLMKCNSIIVSVTYNRCGMLYVNSHVVIGDKREDRYTVSSACRSRFTSFSWALFARRARRSARRNRRKSIPSNHHRSRASIIRNCSFVRAHIVPRFYTHIHAVFTRANALPSERLRQIFAFAADPPRVVSRHESISDQLSFGRVGTYCRLVNS